MSHDAVIIGGGPAGAATALTLARAGRSVAVVERAEFPRRKVCGEFMSGTNAALLDELGVGEAWRGLAGPEIEEVGLYVRDRRTKAPMPAGKGHMARGRALGREVLDGLLLDAARQAGAEVLQPWRATRLERFREGWSVTIRSKKQNEILRAPVLVAAHGSWEPGPLPTQPEKRNAPSDLLGFKAHFRGAGLPERLMPLVVFPGGYGGLVWTDGGRLSLSCCIRRDVLERLRQGGHAPAGEVVRAHIERNCRGAREALHGAAIEGDWLATGPIRPGVRPRYAGDIFRTGNTAGEAHPIIAEGISMALQSGWLLGRELSEIDGADARAREAAGRRYARAWRAQFGTRIRAASALAGLLMSPAGAPVAGALAATWPGILTLGATFSGKTRALPGQPGGPSRL